MTASLEAYDEEPQARARIDYSTAISAAKMAAWTFHVRSRELAATPEFHALLALSPEVRLDTDFVLSRIMPADQARLRECVLAAAQRPDGFFRIDLQIRRFDGELRWFLLRAKAIPSSDGRLREVSGMLIDLTERKLEELDNAYLASVVTSTPYAVVCVDRTGRVTFWNDGAERSYGFTAEEMLGSPLNRIVPEDRNAEAAESLRRVLGGQKCATETERRRKGGERFPVKITAAPIIGPDGSIVGASAISEDRTEALAAKSRLDLLIRELHHRVRNTLATVQGIAGVTAGVSSSIHEFREAFTARIAALAAVHGRLTDDGAQQIRVSELIDKELGPFMSEERVAREGPDVNLSSEIAPTLALVIHELATNAVKHGALKDAGGRIDVGWSVESDRLHFAWTETCRKPPAPPARRGFGSKLLDIVAPAQFSCAVSREFTPTGVRVRFSMPL